MTIVDELRQRLAPMGWALAELDEDDFAGFTRRYDAELSFELGVSLPPQDRGLSLNPTVGVKHQCRSDRALVLVRAGW